MQGLSPQPATVFVGRERELAVLRSCLAAAVAGHGRVVLVCGEPGVGKTRLAEEVAHHAAADGATVRWGRCREGAGTPAFWPWIQILRAQFSAADAADLRAQLGTGAEELVRLVPELHERLPGVPAVALADDEGARFRLFDSVVRFLRASATDQPLVLILEDLHWAQPASVELLRFLIDEMQAARILVIATYRDVEVSEPHPLTQVLQAPSYPPQVQRLALAGLSEEEIGQLIAALGHESSATVAARIQRESGGNPFFAAEIVRGLGTADGSIPGNVRDAISHRLRRLSEGCRRLLGIAAVIGPEFELATLERVAAALGDGGSVLQLVGEAEEARIAVAVPGAGGPAYRFAHALIRDVLYAALPLDERLQLHWQVATALEALGGPDREHCASILAHHFSEAIAGCAEGAPREACIDKAIRYATDAAEQATVMCAYDEALAHYERALRTLETWAAHDRRRQCELLLAMGVAQTRAGIHSSLRSATFQHAAALARQLDEPQLLARSAIGQLQRFTVGEIATAGAEHVASLREALEAVEPQDSGLRAQLLAFLALATHFSAPCLKRLAVSEEALAVGRRCGDLRVLPAVLRSRWLTLTDPSQAEERMALAMELSHLGEQLGDREVSIFARRTRFAEAVKRADIGAARAELAAYTRLAEELRQPAFRKGSLSMRSALALIDGRFDDAERLTLDALPLVTGNPAFTLIMHLAFVYWERDRYGELETRVAEAAEFVGFLPAILATRAHVYAETGRVEEAHAQIERLSDEDLEAMSHVSIAPLFLALLTQAHATLGDTTHAATLYRFLLPYARQLMFEMDGLLCLGSGSLYLGLLADLTGGWDDALRHLDDALATHTRINSAPWIADTNYATAKVLLARNGPGDRERADVLFAQVLQTTDALGMRRLQRRAMALRERMATEAAGSQSSRPLTALLQRDEDFWLIGGQAPAFRMKDRVGLRYLALLLGAPEREFLAIDLTAAIRGKHREAAGCRGGSAPPRAVADAPLPYFDAQARREYAQRLRDLRAAAAEAEAQNDIERASRLREESDLLSEELRRGLGLGRRVRATGSPLERARVAVTLAIREVVRVIGEHDPPLGTYLTKTIKTGTFCSYCPDPHEPVTWRL